MDTREPRRLVFLFIPVYGFEQPVIVDFRGDDPSLRGSRSKSSVREDASSRIMRRAANRTSCSVPASNHAVEISRDHRRRQSHQFEPLHASAMSRPASQERDAGRSLFVSRAARGRRANAEVVVGIAHSLNSSSSSDGVRAHYVAGIARAGDTGASLPVVIPAIPRLLRPTAPSDVEVEVFETTNPFL